MVHEHDTSARPVHVDRLIVHQFDPLRASPGGIDTCLRGIARYAPRDAELAFVGVDATDGGTPERVGHWEVHQFGDRHMHFLPVVSLDPSDQRRRIPHSARLTAGLSRHLGALPERDRVQAHRMDTALVCLAMLRSPLIYFIHTQRAGLTGATSDSFWRHAGQVHHELEKHVVSRASDVVVFNEEYSRDVRKWHPAARFCTTWFDPALLAEGQATAGQREEHQIVWAGRVEPPKDPLLAVESFSLLVQDERSRPWRLHILGSGTLLGAVQERIARLDPEISRRITVHGRVEPSTVASIMASSGLFLMTSHAGYEGYPRVLVESLAAGLPAVVTNGSDTGGLIIDGVNGFVTDRSPRTIAGRLQAAKTIDRSVVTASVARLGAPAVVARLFDQAETRP